MLVCETRPRDTWETGEFASNQNEKQIPSSLPLRFVVLQSNKVHLYYYLDQAGRVPETTEMLCLPSGEMVEPPSPTWGLDIQCGKGTDFSYGPWADRQREILYKFFCPADYQAMTVTPAPAPGQL